MSYGVGESMDFIPRRRYGYTTVRFGSIFAGFDVSVGGLVDIVAAPFINPAKIVQLLYSVGGLAFR